jgi:hypothetical protein
MLTASLLMGSRIGGRVFHPPMAPSLRQKISCRPRSCVCPRTFAIMQGRNPLSDSLSHDKEQYFNNKDRYASMSDIGKLANYLSQVGKCPPAVADDFASIVIFREDFLDSDNYWKIDVLLFIMECGGYLNAKGAANLVAITLERIVETSDETWISSTWVSLPQAARLFVVSSKLISTFMENLSPPESIFHLIRIRHYSFEGVKDYICLKLSNPVVSKEELVPLVAALKVIQKAGYLNLSHEKIKKYIGERGTLFEQRSYRSYSAEYKMHERGYTSFSNRISKAIVAEVKNTPLETPKAQKRMLFAVTCLIKEAGMVTLMPVQKSIEKQIEESRQKDASGKKEEKK